MNRVVGTSLLLSIGLAACDGKVRFNEINVGSKQSVIPTPVVENAHNKTQGNCAADSSTSVASCVQCQVPVLPPPEPPMSLKAKQLMNIMTTVCPINAARYGYASPTLADHKAKLNRCTTSIYPDSTPDAGQNDVVQRLLNGDTALQKKMFTGLWYTPPYSDYFETYFGLEVGQAIQVFCEQSVPNISGMLMPSMTAPNPYGPAYNPGDKIPDMYVKANNYRDGLATCIAQSKTYPWQPGPQPAAKVCTYETIDGVNDDKVAAQVASWLEGGYTVGADLKNMSICLSVKSLSDIQGYQGEINAGAYICR